MAKKQISHEEISRQAYILWEKEGRKHGQDVQYWLKAERLLSEQGSQAADSAPKSSKKSNGAEKKSAYIPTAPGRNAEAGLARASTR